MVLNQRKAGAVLSYAGLIVNAIISFIYVPLLLRFLTEGQYGVYELIGSIIAYLSVMDMGLSTTLSRFYVREKSLENEKGVSNLLAMSLVIYVVLTIIAVAVGIVFNFCLDGLFEDIFTVDELVLAHKMMVLVIINCIIVLPGNWFLALINANERFVFVRSIAIAKYVLQVIVILVVLMWRSSAVLVLVVQVVFNAIVIVFYAVYAKKKLSLIVRLYFWDWKLLGSLFAFSGFILLNMVFDQVFWKTGQVVLGATCSAAAVAVYGITCKIITSGYMQVSTGVTSVFLPKITAISARSNDMREVNDLFCRIGRIQSMLVWGVCSAFFAIGAGFIELWAGPSFSEAYPATCILMLGLSISLIQNLGITILQAKNRMGFRSTVYIILAALDVVLSIPVSEQYGVIGCASVAAILLFMGTGPIINWYYHFRIGIDIPRFFRSVGPLVLPALISGFAAWFLVQFLALPVSWLAFLAEAVFFLTFYFILLWVFWMNDYEKNLFRSVARKIRRMDANPTDNEVE